jgi:vancomycin permeability regulator SanA
LIWLLIALALAPPLALLLLAALLRLGATGRIHDPADAPRRPVALVLGARVFAPGVPTTMLEARLEAAAELLRLGAAEKLLLTGDGGHFGPDEVATMRAWLLSHGVPEDRLLLDRDGVRTLTSLVRARDHFAVRSCLVVTNPFHLPRTLFLARFAGLDAQGVAARPGAPIRRRTRLHNWNRERLGQLRAVWDVLRGRAR